MYDRLKEEDRQVIELNFSDVPGKSEVLCTTKFMRIQI